MKEGDSLFSNPVYNFLLFKKTGQVSHLAKAIEVVNQTAIAPILSPSCSIKITWLHHQVSLYTNPNNNNNLSAHKLDSYLYCLINSDIIHVNEINNAISHILYYSKHFDLASYEGILTKQIHTIYSQSKRSIFTKNTKSTIRLYKNGGLLLELDLLINLHAKGIAPQLIQEILHNELKFLISTRRETDFSKGQYAIFPDLVFNDGSGHSYSNKLSWASGVDLPIALLLYQAELLFHDSELGRIADLVGLNTTLRTDSSSSGLQNAYFQEGSAGVAYLYYKLYRLTKNPAYEKSFRFWQHHLQKQIMHEEAIALLPGQRPELLSEFWEAKALLHLLPQQNISISADYLDISAVEL
ncbi:hypothetical protein KLP40_08210 [Hymenobacter sp. NST-14]|uniref:hypothetical protein n=1 Tax=Hymenobacter piscis TaxID=2839984 RepID=UPI001C0106A7|nr:hypothetical protein [Hymenobacter piscis]MBT9393145.1 hypothetical protein [Hymenobacter piscis]